MVAILKEADGGMEASDLKRMKKLEEENRRLKQMYADLSLENHDDEGSHPWVLHYPSTGITPQV